MTDYKSVDIFKHIYRADTHTHGLAQTCTDVHGLGKIYTDFIKCARTP